MKKIIIYTCVWKRPAITRICFEGIKRLIRQLPYHVSAHVCVSEKWAQEMADEFGFTHTFTENKPLGRKHNKGLFDIIGRDFDYVLHLGSDNILDIRLLEMYEPYIKKKLDLIGCGQAYVTDGITTKRINCEPFMVGAGRMFSKRILKRAGFRRKIIFKKDSKDYWVNDSEWQQLEEREECKMTEQRDFMLWDDSINEGLDADSHYRMIFARASNKCVHLEPHQAYAADLKSRTNIHPFEGMECDGEAVPVSDIDIPEMQAYLQHIQMLTPVI